MKLREFYDWCVAKQACEEGLDWLLEFTWTSDAIEVCRRMPLHHLTWVASKCRGYWVVDKECRRVTGDREYANMESDYEGCRAEDRKAIRRVLLDIVRPVVAAPAKRRKRVVR